MQKKIFVGILVMATLPTVAMGATTTYYSGQFCSSTGWNDTFASADQGLQNAADYDGTVWCPASWSTSSSNGQANASEVINAATLVYSDMSSGSFNCHVVEENWDGSLHASASLYSCPTYGGCSSDSDPGWQGGGQLNFVNPVAGGAAFYATSISLACRVPGSGSLVRGYNFTLN